MPSPSVIAVTHADDPLGHRVVSRLGEGGTRIVAVADTDGQAHAAELKRTLHGVDTLVHLAAVTAEPLEATIRVLDAASDAGIERLVVLSSALVYGAWPSNPVPLTDDAPLRPNPDFAPAVALGQVERLLADWRDAHPSATVGVLRPTVPVAEDAAGWLDPMLGAVRGVPVGEDDPPAQFVHLDDVAAAIAVAVSAELDGVANVAPDGWIRGEDLRALAGGPRVRLPGRLAERLTSWRWRAGLSPTPPGLLPWTVHPWVVASDKLKALGWEASHSNEEAFVVGHKAMPWATVSPRRRQELTLGISAVAIVGGAVGAGLGIRRLLRRRSN
jgi:nucleoside-diphosphate-sugar epimerase